MIAQGMNKLNEQDEIFPVLTTNRQGNVIAELKPEDRQLLEEINRKLDILLINRGIFGEWHIPHVAPMKNGE